MYAQRVLRCICPGYNHSMMVICGCSQVTLWLIIHEQVCILHLVRAQQNGHHSGDEDCLMYGQHIRLTLSQVIIGNICRHNPAEAVFASGAIVSKDTSWPSKSLITNAVELPTTQVSAWLSSSQRTLSLPEVLVLATRVPSRRVGRGETNATLIL